MKINITKNEEEVIDTLGRWSNFKGNCNGKATLTTLYKWGLRAWIKNDGNFSVLKYDATILEFDKDSGKILVYNNKGIYDDKDIPNYHGDVYDNYNDLLLDIRNGEEAKLCTDFWSVTNFDNVNISINY